MDLHEFLLHFEEVGEGEGQDHHDQTCLEGWLPVEEIQRNLRENIHSLLNDYLIFLKKKAKKLSLPLGATPREEVIVELIADFLVEASIFRDN